ncbi:paraquat-inducible protein A [Succinimonas amylolytica]|uniref:paraquat-inducible protein A n=1 Tax=Succinimonas amylolytica TaxID=83769 RepID=UPI0023A7C3E3
MSDTPEKLICGQCDLVLEIPRKEGHFVGYCPRCHNAVHHYRVRPSKVSLCYALSAIFFMFATDSLPFISISAAGIEQGMQVLDYTTVLGAQDMWAASFIIFLFMQLLPLLTLLTIIAGDLGKILGKRFFFMPLLLKILHFNVEWSMVEVFMVGILVSLIKLISLVSIQYGAGFWTFFAFAIFYLLAVSRFSEEEMWNFYVPHTKTPGGRIPESGIRAEPQDFCACSCCGEILDIRTETSCHRCGTGIRDRSSQSLGKTLAFTLAAIVMYIPANIYPMMITTYLGSDSESTVIDGVIVLWGMGSYFVASVILIASIFIPIMKILLLLYLCWSVKKLRKTRNRLFLSVIYRVVEFIGKWSMVDVFVVAIMATIVRVQNLMTIYAGSAMISFAAVVILTMIAARSFDPRLLWGYGRERKNAGTSRDTEEGTPEDRSPDENAVPESGKVPHPA